MLPSSGLAWKQQINKQTKNTIATMGHFWVAFCLWVKTSLRAKTFIRQRVPPSGWFSCKSNLFSKVFHEDSFWNRDARLLGNGLLCLYEARNTLSASDLICITKNKIKLTCCSKTCYPALGNSAKDVGVSLVINFVCKYFFGTSIDRESRYIAKM